MIPSCWSLMGLQARENLWPSLMGLSDTLSNWSYSWKQYIADVAGYITNVGRPIQQRTCSRTLDFYLANQSSSTLISDDADIHALKELRAENNVMEMTKEVMSVDFSETRVVRIDNIRTRKGWNFPTCGGDKCKKGVCRKLKGWWCNACDQEVAYHVLRFKLELGVSDETTHVVVVMFDETDSELVKCSADLIAQAEEESLDDDSNLEELEDSDAELSATPAEEKKKKRCVGYKVGRPGPGDYTSHGKAVRVMQNK
ncbi:nucleic acid-binding, OB-fold protein [Tanacetum coccineum]|uniref:Nucleic acid-binding, OB-fold protein n=1 Tax=Tanacetum coccineum TaxID=301880 RepID=A0ABQ5C0D0_9ASTR